MGGGLGVSTSCCPKKSYDTVSLILRSFSAFQWILKRKANVLSALEPPDFYGAENQRLKNAAELLCLKIYICYDRSPKLYISGILHAILYSMRSGLFNMGKERSINVRFAICEILKIAPLAVHLNQWKFGSCKPWLLIPRTQQAPRLKLVNFVSKFQKFGRIF